MALAAGSLHSRAQQMEDAASSALRKYETRHLLAVSVVTVLLVGGTQLAVKGTDLAIVASRAVLVWLGLALLSGRIFGRWLSWILPVATIFPLTYLGQDHTGQDYWWDWTGQQPSSIACWVIAALSMAAGLAAFYLTSWHVHGWRSRARR
ncbi:hypothetical protein [Kitasatospora sp. NPDC056531]|uniref:hypothetical protein n=1 Tax=Kitasatospora sp. NPDC056531 TaxID=3345856 RepID=UPI0036BD3901